MISEVMTYSKAFDELSVTRSKSSLRYGMDQSDNARATYEWGWMGLRRVLRIGSEQSPVEMIKNVFSAITCASQFVRGVAFLD